MGLIIILKDTSYNVVFVEYGSLCLHDSLIEGNM